ncbi:MAG: hypothetical protein QM518_15060 [Verrucomicrobiota bacterium]|nr:hypothetical protein [Verrucomicrobiota bacterium]
MSESGSGSVSESESVPVLYATLPYEYRSNLTAEFCQHPNNTVALPGFFCPNPIPCPFDTETDSDPDPDLASPLAFSDGLKQSTLPLKQSERGVQSTD